MNKKRPFGALLGVILLGATLLGQTAGILHGQVLDELGAVIKGATVTLVAKDGKKRAVTTNANGEFSVPNLAPGIYTLMIVFKGFQPYIENGIDLASIPAPLKVTLKVASVTESTDVSAEGNGISVEPDQNMTGIVLDEKMIEDLLPDNEDDMTEFLQALAGGTGNAQILIDGFNGGHLPPREAIMQIRINQNPFSPEYSSGGSQGRIEIITKPGLGEWRGNISIGLRNSALDARNAFALARPELDQQRYSLFFGGPLIPKRLDFSANADWTPTYGDGLVSAITPDGRFTANVPAPSRNVGGSIRSGLSINKENMLRMNYSYRGSERTNSEFAPSFGGGMFGGAIPFAGGGGGGSSSTGGSLILPERASNTESGNHSLWFSETYLINSQLVNEARFRIQQDTVRTMPVTQAVAVNVLDAFQGGGSTQSSDIRTNTAELQDSLTMTFKKHTIKMGFQLEQDTVRDLNLNNFNGTYSFSTLDQYSPALAGELVNATLFTINRVVDGSDPQLHYGQYEAAWYVNDDIRLNPSLTISLGLRHEFQQHLDDKLNFAPRLSIAWAPFRDRKTVVRAGGGIFYSRLSATTYADTLRYNNETLQTITIFNPFYLNPLPADLSALGPVLQQITARDVLDQHLRAPYSINGMLSLEHQFPKGLVGTVSYSINRGLHLFRTRDINAPLPETGERPDPTQGEIIATESAGKSLRHEVAFGFSRRFGQRLTFFSNYRLAWACDDVAFPANSYDLSSEWARSSTDRRHSFNILLMANLPWGLRLTPNVFINSGMPFNITTGLDDNLEPQFTDRPAGIGRNSDLPASLYPLIPQPDRLVRLANGTTLTLIDYLMTYFPNGLIAEGPSSFNANIGIAKTFGFGPKRGQGNRPPADDIGITGGEQGGRIIRGGGGFGRRSGGDESSRFTLRFAVNFTNIFNHVNFGQYGGTLGSPYLGFPNNAAAPRQVNLNLMFGF